MRKTVIAIIITVIISCFMMAFDTNTVEQEEITKETYVLETVDVEKGLDGLDLEAQVDSLTNTKALAHEMAESARKLGFAEDHEIIQAAKTIWHDADELWKIKNKELEESKKINLGTFKLTAYCPCSKCCGQWANGITATGTTATANHTIAVDPRVIPYGSTVYIEGLGTFVAEDCGGGIKGNRIDIFYNTHSEALNSGVTALNPTVYLIK